MSYSAPTLLVQHLKLAFFKVSHSSCMHGIIHVVSFMWLMQERCGVRVAGGPYNCTDGTIVPKDVKHL